MFAMVELWVSRSLKCEVSRCFLDCQSSGLADGHVCLRCPYRACQPGGLEHSGRSSGQLHLEHANTQCGKWGGQQRRLTTDL